MKNIYKITKNQLIAVWVFSLITLVFFAYNFNDYCYVADIFDCKTKEYVFPFFAVAFVVVFYTIGWNSHKKE